MKKAIILSAVALMVFAATSCQKEEAIKHFTATTEQGDAKTYLDGSLIKWNSGDKVAVYGRSGSGAEFTVTPRTNPTWADLDYVSGNLGFGPYKAIYPYDYAASSTTIMLPTARYSSDIELANFPMYAESTTDEFQFKNLCGVLKIRLQQENVTISSIKVTASSPIAGTFTIGGTASEPTLTAASGNTNTEIRLNPSSPISITSAHDFYVYLPAGSYSSISLDIVDNSHRVCTKSGSNINIVRSAIHPISVSEMVFDGTAITDNGALPGLFSVSTTKQVRFSQGNLQYQASTGTWRFATNQYDYVGTQMWPEETGYYNGGTVTSSDNHDIASSYTGWIDLFGWGTSGYHNSTDSYNTNYLPYSTAFDQVNTTYNYYGYGPSTNITDPSLTGTSATYDWGVYNAISNGGNQAGMWRTLTNAEWSYIFESRTNARSKYATGRIEMNNGTYTNGCIILPDSWTLPTDLSFNSGAHDYSNNTYTSAQWNQMESAGATFLPAAGFRQGSNVSDVGKFGTYWTTTYLTNGYAYGCYFGGTLIGANYYSRYRGYSVRLVQDYN